MEKISSCGSKEIEGMLQSLGKNFLLLKGMIISNYIGVKYFLDILRGGEGACFCFALLIGQKYVFLFLFLSETLVVCYV